MLRITKNIEEANLVTHASKFHPDDVFATAFLSLLYPNSIVYRASKIDKEYKDKIIYDIGFGKYDHHQVDALMRNEKIKYSSFGLLWKDFGENYLKGLTEYYKEVFSNIDEKLVCQIDGIDNGNFYKLEADYYLLDLDKIIDLYNFEWDSKEDNDENFIKAVTLAIDIINNLIKREIADAKAFKIVTEKLKVLDSNILYLEEHLPYIDAIFASPISNKVDAVIYPSNRGGYNIKPLTIDKDSKELKVNFPKEWWGLHDEELASISGIKTASFIHSTGFVAATLTLEDAYLLASKLK